MGVTKKQLIDPKEMDLNPSGAAHPYIIGLEVAQVSDDANPDKECRRSKQDAAQIVVCEILGNEKTDVLVKYSIPLSSGTSLETDWKKNGLPASL